MYVNAPNPDLLPWTNKDEDALNVLRAKDIGLSDTALAVSTNQMSKGIKNKVRILECPEQRELLDVLNNVSPESNLTNQLVEEIEQRPVWSSQSVCVLWMFRLDIEVL